MLHSGDDQKLYYLKNKDGREIDFCVAVDGRPALLVEVKWKDDNLSPNFDIFRRFFSDIEMVQVSKELKRTKTFPNGARIRRASE